MDELLYNRVKQLREIDDRLDQIGRLLNTRPGAVGQALVGLRIDLAKMIDDAEADYLAF